MTKSTPLTPTAARTNLEKRLAAEGFHLPTSSSAKEILDTVRMVYNGTVGNERRAIGEILALAETMNMPGKNTDTRGAEALFR